MEKGTETRLLTTGWQESRPYRRRLTGAGTESMLSVYERHVTGRDGVCELMSMRN